MKQDKLSFKSENLAVDWISFKFQELENPSCEIVVNYLFELGFNSYQINGKLANPTKEAIRVNSKNKFKVIFVKEGPYWNGTILQFSGKNALFFYICIQKRLVPWKIFSSAILNRFDLCYSRNKKVKDKVSVEDFLSDCQKKILKTTKNVSLDRNTKGLILKIGNRRTNSYSRIYETENYLKFEYEMKGKLLQDHHFLLISDFNCLEEFENKLSNYFIRYFGKLLPLDYSYLDWLATKLRPIRKQLIPEVVLNSDYLKPDSLQLFTERKKLITFLQFLSFAKKLDYTRDYLSGTPFRAVTFRVRDFLKYQYPITKSDEKPYMKNLIKFFGELRDNSVIESFSDNHYSSLVTIPKVDLKKSDLNCWVAKVSIAEELFHYQHPFVLPDLFKEKNTKDEFEVLYKFIQVFASVDIKKEFYIEEFISHNFNAISNERKTKIKKCFIELVKTLEEYDLVESGYKIISNNMYYNTNELTTKNISQGFIIYEKLNF
jgi:hypothetical protein